MSGRKWLENKGGKERGRKRAGKRGGENRRE